MRFHIKSSSYHHYACTMPIYNYCILLLKVCDWSILITNTKRDFYLYVIGQFL